MQYYAVINGERTGPYTGEEFQQRVDAGDILPNTLVWRQGMTEWKPFAQLNAAPETAGKGGRIRGRGDGAKGCALCNP